MSQELAVGPSKAERRNIGFISGVRGSAREDHASLTKSGDPSA